MPRTQIASATPPAKRVRHSTQRDDFLYEGEEGFPPEQTPPASWERRSRRGRSYTTAPLSQAGANQSPGLRPSTASQGAGRAKRTLSDRTNVAADHFRDAIRHQKGRFSDPRILGKENDLATSGSKGPMDESETQIEQIEEDDDDGSSELTEEEDSVRAVPDVVRPQTSISSRRQAARQSSGPKTAPLNSQESISSARFGGEETHNGWDDFDGLQAEDGSDSRGDDMPAGGADFDVTRGGDTARLDDNETFLEPSLRSSQGSFRALHEELDSSGNMLYSSPTYERGQRARNVPQPDRGGGATLNVTKMADFMAGIKSSVDYLVRTQETLARGQAELAARVEDLAATQAEHGDTVALLTQGRRGGVRRKHHEESHPRVETNAAAMSGFSRLLHQLHGSTKYAEKLPGYTVATALRFTLSSDLNTEDLDALAKGEAVPKLSTRPLRIDWASQVTGCAFEVAIAAWGEKKLRAERSTYNIPDDISAAVLRESCKVSLRQRMYREAARLRDPEGYEEKTKSSKIKSRRKERAKRRTFARSAKLPSLSDYESDDPRMDALKIELVSEDESCDEWPGAQPQGSQAQLQPKSGTKGVLQVPAWSSKELLQTVAKLDFLRGANASSHAVLRPDYLVEPLDADPNYQISIKARRWMVSSEWASLHPLACEHVQPNRRRWKHFERDTWGSPSGLAVRHSSTS